MSLQQQFCTKTEAQAFKAELQVDGYIASIKPLFRSPQKNASAHSSGDRSTWPMGKRLAAAGADVDELSSGAAREPE